MAVESYLDGDGISALATKIGDKAEALYIGGYYTEASKLLSRPPGGVKSGYWVQTVLLRKTC